ncbi:MAG: GGDEF domain-containing protein [Desulfurella sp.]|uniref:GGDEF domain-containing protein n=1 Tax=Desulfurella sp. TaxID=1962857 RepID=UPI003C75A34C
MKISKREFKLIFAYKTTRYIFIFWLIFNIIMLVSFIGSIIALYSYELNRTKLELLTAARQSSSLVSKSIQSNKYILFAIKKELENKPLSKATSVFKEFYNKDVEYFAIAKQNGTVIASYPEGFKLPLDSKIYPNHIVDVAKECLHTNSYCIVPSYFYKGYLTHFDTFPLGNKTFLIKASAPVLQSIKDQIFLPYKSLDLGIIRNDGLMQANIPPESIGKIQTGILSKILKNTKEQYGSYIGYSSAYKTDEIGAFSRIDGSNLTFFVSIKKSEFLDRFLASISLIIAIAFLGAFASLITILWILDKTIDLEETKRKYEKGIEYLAYNDILTHIPNRAFFEHRFNQMIAGLNRNQRKVCLMLLDLDGFKKINDTLGHDSGDNTLKTVAKVFKSNIRAHDTLARIGGDEFAILTDSFEDQKDLEMIAKRIIKSINSLIFTNNMDLNIGVSIGIAYTTHPQTKEAIFKAADDALYASKQKGKNTYTIVRI